MDEIVVTTRDVVRCIRAAAPDPSVCTVPEFAGVRDAVKYFEKMVLDDVSAPFFSVLVMDTLGRPAPLGDALDALDDVGCLPRCIYGMVTVTPFGDAAVLSNAGPTYWCENDRFLPVFDSSYGLSRLIDVDGLPVIEWSPPKIGPMARRPREVPLVIVSRTGMSAHLQVEWGCNPLQIGEIASAPDEVHRATVEPDDAEAFRNRWLLPWVQQVPCCRFED